ncbi:hypothetical protein [Nocardia farcinica]|uniref:hypothetical protein n=1 Tax=Nocardia farcinica TaxID=37329 RepID=UPI001E30F7C9|nr:hypothetical protein [Nocardia farcinica]
MRALFPAVTAEIARIRPVEELRWITFGHVEADECGSMNLFLAAAPHAQVAHGALGCAVSLDDMADRPPRPLADGEVIDLGDRRVQHIDTPHAPHNWEARVLYEQTTGVLFCGDLMTQLGDGPALTDADLVEPAAAAEDVFHATSIGPAVPPPCAAWPSWPRPPWRSCTAPASRATAGRPCAIWRASTTTG